MAKNEQEILIKTNVREDGTFTSDTSEIDFTICNNKLNDYNTKKVKLPSFSSEWIQLMD